MSFFNTIKKEDFYIDITEKNQVPYGYKNLRFCHDNVEIYNNSIPFHIKNVVSRRLFPLYLKPSFLTNGNLLIKKVPENKIYGYAIVLKENQDIETFLKNEYRKSFRLNIKRFVNRFESCFNTSYKMFYGDISKEDYSSLMNNLNKMLINRFNQRNDENKVLKNWKHYESTTYNLIKNKKASIFVIYNNAVPVHICINHHYDKILFISIPSFDIDYSKFALGNISIYKLLEWSINNQYKMLDMAYGDLEYKRRWSTLIYPFEHHVFYNNKLIQKCLAQFEITVIRFKNYLKSKNVDEKARQLKSKHFKTKNNFKEVTYNSEPFILSNIHYKKIDFQLENNELGFLKKAVFEFLYKHKTHIDQIEVFEINDSSSFIITNKKNTEKITIKL
jgi:hypothetical protein